MRVLLYGGLGLLPLWLLIGYALLAQPAAVAEPSEAMVWWSVGALPACLMTLMFAEAIVFSREPRHDPWRQHKILLIVLPMAVLLLASGLTWERQEEARVEEEARITRFVASDPAVVAWLGRNAETRITLSQPNTDLTGAPLRYWVTADAGLRRVQAVVAVDRSIASAPLVLVCVEREVLPVRGRVALVREGMALRCG
jgi:hypothetical protein